LIPEARVPKLAAGVSRSDLAGRSEKPIEQGQIFRVIQINSQRSESSASLNGSIAVYHAL